MTALPVTATVFSTSRVWSFRLEIQQFGGGVTGETWLRPPPEEEEEEEESSSLLLTMSRGHQIEAPECQSD